METLLIPATLDDAHDYVRIGARTISRFNHVTTDLAAATQEIAQSTTYMIDFKGRRVGFIAYTKPAPDQAYIVEVQIDPDYQRRGIGGHALDFVLHEVEDSRVVYLYTHPKNPAQKLYRRHGFQPTGEIIEDYRGFGPRMRMERK